MRCRCKKNKQKSHKLLTGLNKTSLKKEEEEEEEKYQKDNRTKCKGRQHY